MPNLVLIRPLCVPLPREIDDKTRVLRVPSDMSRMTATVTDQGDGTALVFWSGWRPGAAYDSCGIGRICRFVLLRTLLDEREAGVPLRVLVPDVDPAATWDVADVLDAMSGVDRVLAALRPREAAAS